MPVSANSRNAAGISMLGTSTFGVAKCAASTLALLISSSNAAPSDPAGLIFALMVASVMISFSLLGRHRTWFRDRRLPVRKLEAGISTFTIEFDFPHLIVCGRVGRCSALAFQRFLVLRQRE